MIPHVTHNDEADITELEAWRKRLNSEQSDVKVTMVAFLVKACVAALKEFEVVNSSLDGDELVFDRSLGRSRNAVVLPAGWYVTASATPATVSSMADGRVRVEYWDDQPDAVEVLLKARRRVE